jgi:hypothetical protein
MKNVFIDPPCAIEANSFCSNMIYPDDIFYCLHDNVNYASYSANCIIEVESYHICALKSDWSDTSSLSSTLGKYNNRKHLFSTLGKYNNRKQFDKLPCWAMYESSEKDPLQHIMSRNSFNSYYTYHDKAHRKIKNNEGQNVDDAQNRDDDELDQDEGEESPENDTEQDNDSKKKTKHDHISHAVIGIISYSTILLYHNFV